MRGMGTSSAAETVLSSIETTMAWQEEVYRDLHRHPELSFEETRTNDCVAQRLEDLGYDVQRIGGGVVGTLTNGNGPVVLFRADTDALPVEEKTELPYASTVPGVMHACGHDMHVAAALGAAALLAEHRAAWQGTYIALFQPAEEAGGGAQAMVDAGLAAHIPAPDVALAQHVEPTTTGQAGIAAGPRFSQADSLRVVVHGTGSHGSQPHLGVDPVVTAAAIVLRLQTVVAREIAPDDFGVLTVGALHAGTASNVIPDRAELLVDIRAYDPAVRERLLRAVTRIIEGECAAAGCPQPPSIEPYDQYPLTHNDPEVTERVEGALRDVLGPDSVHELAPDTSSEDFSNIPDALGVPYTYWTFGGYPEGADAVPNHNPRFAPVIQPTLETGTRAAVAAALAWLAKDD